MSMEEPEQNESERKLARQAELFAEQRVAEQKETAHLPHLDTHAGEPPADSLARVIFDVRNVSIYYGSFKAVTDVSLPVHANEVTAFIGSSGSGKSTVLRAFNRMNDLVPGARVDGTITYRGTDLYGKDVSPTAVRRRIGMVFQKPNPFPKSIYDNVAYGPRINGQRNKAKLDEIVERSLRGAVLWDEVKNRLKQSALALSGGQAQRLCIARTIAVEPDVVLMDEPASALDPIATGAIEDLIHELKQNYTIVIVTHNMQQATRVSDRTAFFSVLTDAESDIRTGVLVEFGPTQQIFEDPRDSRTQAYVTGRMG
jgi:phosphate transport system ATP-binding protein